LLQSLTPLSSTPPLPFTHSCLHSLFNRVISCPFDKNKHPQSEWRGCQQNHSPYIMNNCTSIRLTIPCTRSKPCTKFFTIRSKPYLRFGCTGHITCPLAYTYGICMKGSSTFEVLSALRKIHGADVHISAIMRRSKMNMSDLLREHTRRERRDLDQIRPHIHTMRMFPAEL